MAADTWDALESAGTSVAPPVAAGTPVAAPVAAGTSVAPPVVTAMNPS